MSFFRGKKILVTGATGSIGMGVVRQILLLQPKVVRLFSRDEHKLFLAQQEFGNSESVRYLMGDVRDRDRIIMAMESVDYVFHCAACKHVPFCEYNSFEAVKTNVVGTQNVIDAALTANVDRVLLISTDKAVHPPNVMGATKLLAEKLMSSAMQSRGSHPTIFGSVRFGNVLGSRGSVIPIICKQIREGCPVTVTHPDMIRFFMSIPQAVSLTFAAMEKMQGGELFVLKMPAMRIGDLIDVLIQEVASSCNLNPNAVEKKIIGVRPGERMCEGLLTIDEAQYAKDLGNMFVIPSTLDVLRLVSKDSAVAERYAKGDVDLLNKDEIRDLILPICRNI